MRTRHVRGGGGPHRKKEVRERRGKSNECNDGTSFSLIRKGTVARENTWRLRCTDRKIEEALDEVEREEKRKERRRRARLKKLFDDRFDAILTLHTLLSLSKNKFAKPLYPVLVSKCPTRRISASRLVIVLTDTYAFENHRSMERVVGRIVRSMWAGNPLTRCTSRPFHHELTAKNKTIDYRELCCALRVFQYPDEDTTRRLTKMFDIFDVNRTQSLARSEVEVILHVPAVDPEEHAEMTQLGHEAFGPLRGREERRVPRGIYVRAIESLVDTFERLVQNRIPLNQKLDVQMKRMEKSKSEADFLRRKLQWRSVRSFYERNCMNDNLYSRWRRWRAFVKERRMMKRAEVHLDRARKNCGLRRWNKFMDWRARHRTLRNVAMSHRRRWVLNRHFFLWYCFLEQSVIQSRENKRKAYEFYRTTTLKHFFRDWDWYRLHQKAFKFRRRMDMKKSFNALIYYCHIEMENRMRLEREARERSAMLQREILRTNESAERILMEKEEDYMRELMRIEEIEIMQKRRDEEYAMRLDYATHRANQRRLWRKQVEGRIAHKKETRKKEKRDFRKTWATLGDDSMKQCKEDTLKWIRETPEGRTTIKVNSKMIYKVWNECIEDFETPEMALWQGIYDPIYGSIFFFNVETKEKIGTKTFSNEEARMVAIDHYLARQMKQSIEYVQKTKVREKQNNLENKSALYIQNLWRSRKSRKLMREVVRRLYEIRIDVETGDTYYYHMYKKTKQQMKPRILGSEKLKVPAYARVRDPKGRYLFYNTKQPWLSSEEKPPGFMLCAECNFFLARRHCKNCKENFCIDCHLSFHTKGKRRFHEWDKFEVVAQTCDVCKTKVASVLCHECGGALYCEKCSRMIHSTDSKKNHNFSAF